MNRHSMPWMICLATISAARADAQFIIKDLIGGHESERLGASIARIPDWNGDGIDEIAIGSSGNGTVPFVGGGKVTVYSGSDWSPLRVIPGTTPTQAFGTCVVDAGDFDDDGVHDVAVGIPFYGVLTNRTGAFRVYSGATGQLLMSATGHQAEEQYGAALSAIGDVDGDSTMDFVVGAPYWSELPVGQHTGRAEVVSGATAAVLATLHGTHATHTKFGWAAAPAGDVNADGIPDFIIGSPLESLGVHPNGTGFDRNGTVRVYSGSNFSVLHMIAGEQDVMTLGRSVSGAGDVDGDGHADFLAGAPGWDDPAGILRGTVRLYSGATGQVLLAVGGRTSEEHCGWGVRGGVDVDLDGVPDFVIAGRQNSSQGLGVARLVSGATGLDLEVVSGMYPGGLFGTAVEILDDISGDGRPDFAIGAPTANSNGGEGGHVRVVRTFSPPTSYCVAAPNSTGQPALLSWSGSLSVSADELQLRCSGLPTNSSGRLFFGKSQTQTPFGDGFLCTAGTLARFPKALVAANGVVDIDVQFRALPSTAVLQAGDVRYFQFWYRDTASVGAGFNLSDALSVPFCP